MTRSSPAIRWIVSTLGACVLALFSSGCVTHHHYTSGAPVHRAQLPPPTPADGYHYAFDGVTLVFDGSWGGYRVREHPDHYFHLDFYYRLHNGAWERCARLGGPWRRIDGDALPVGLRAHRGERHDARQERREDRRDVRHERRDELKEQRVEHRDERRVVKQKQRKQQTEAKQTKQKKHGKDDAKDGVPANQVD